LIGVGVMNDDMKEIFKNIFLVLLGSGIQESEAELCTFSEIKIQISV
jgi:hypothetical protein